MLRRALPIGGVFCVSLVCASLSPGSLPEGLARGRLGKGEVVGIREREGYYAAQ